MSTNENTAPDLAAIRARLDAVLPPPWTVEGNQLFHLESGEFIADLYEHDEHIGFEPYEGFFINAPTDMRALLDENARLTALIEMNKQAAPIRAQDTPRTDAEAFDTNGCDLGPLPNEYCPDGMYVSPDFARTLERELNAALSLVETLTKERIEAQEQTLHFRNVTTMELEAMRKCRLLMKDYQSGGEDPQDFIDLVSDWVKTAAAIPEGKYEGADTLEDVFRWMLKDRASLAMALRELVDEMQPMLLVIADAPRAASESHDFDRGCPLTKTQVRAMQDAVVKAAKLIP